MSGLDLEQKSSRTSALNCNKPSKVVHTTRSVKLLKKKKELVEQIGNESSPIDFHVRSDGSWPSDKAKELHDSTGKLNANDDGSANSGDGSDTNSDDNGALI
ncbi:hypothetical protein WN943_002801 [Citrus x changshan-huyou]